MTIAQAALALAESGFSVFPLHTPNPDLPGGCSCRDGACESVGKHPRTRNGLNDATADVERVRQWWGMFPEANIGLRTGLELKSGGSLVVLDIDPRNDGDAELEALERKHGPLPATTTIRTGGGGWHYYYRAEEPVRTRKLAAGIDLKAGGGYVVASPSLHASGHRYVREGRAGIARWPGWLLDAATAGRDKAPAPPLDEVIQKGMRDVTLASLAGTLRRRGLTAPEILPCLLAVNEMRCDPPLPERDLVRIATSVARKTAARPLVVRGAR